MSNYTAVAYFGGIPPSNNNPEKPLILNNFLQGVRASGDNAIMHQGFNVLDCDVALIQGFVHEHGKSAPHLQLRQRAVEKQKTTGKKSLIVDSNLFLYADPGNTKHYLRYSFDGVFPTTGYYFTEEVDPNRWKKISGNLGITLKPYRTSGNHILICCQRNGGWSMKGVLVQDWLDQTIKKVREYTDRPIIVRPHPGDKKWRNYLQLQGYSNVQLSTQHIIQDLKNAWATVLHNSSPAVASAIEGVPVFLTDSEPQYSQAAEVSNTNFKRLEDPKMYDRQAWIEKLSMCHWNFDELKSGEAWQFFRKFI
tara:strand:- start:1811 stop:2734 length:924 start_codon:yes stop_codon:yes gene_type:complete